MDARIHDRKMEENNYHDDRPTFVVCRDGPWRIGTFWDLKAKMEVDGQVLV